MVVAYIDWATPREELGFNYTKVYKNENIIDSGNWVELTTVDSPHYTADGVPINQTWTRDLNAVKGAFYRVRYFDSINDKYSEYSGAMRVFGFAGYCLISDIRRISKVSQQEYDDEDIQLMIDSMAAEIDRRTARTWQGTQEVVDECLDSENISGLFLNHGDVWNIRSLEIYDYIKEEFVNITPAYVDLYGEEGRIILDPRIFPNLEVPIFPKGRKTVKVSYNYGFSEPTSDVRLLCILKVLQLMRVESVRNTQINSLMNDITRRTVETL